MGVRAVMLELAILGELEQPLHGYELRQRLSAALGPVRRLSFGSLYPALHRLAEAGLIDELVPAEQRAPRRQVVYQVTDRGRAHLAEHLAEASTDDESLGLTMRLMSKASPQARLELLGQRRAEVLQSRDAHRKASKSTDSWVRSRARLEAKQDDTELAWLDRQIAKLSGPKLPTPKKVKKTKKPQKENS